MAINIMQPEALALPAPRLPGSKIGHRLLGPTAKFAVGRGVSASTSALPGPGPGPAHVFQLYLL